MMPGRGLLAVVERKARIHLALKYFMVLEAVQTRLNSDGHRHSALQTLSRLDGLQISDCATRFLEYAVHMAYSDLEAQRSVSAEAEYLFIAHSLDSFFHLLKEDDLFPLFPPRPRRLVLPSLELEIPLAAESFQLSKTRAGLLALTRQNGVALYQPSTPGPTALPKIPVTDRANLMLCDASILCDPMFDRTRAELETAEGIVLAAEIRKALELISLADRALAEELESHIRWFFPILTPDKNTTHNSFSLSNLFGAIFLSESYAHFHLAEAIVHEYYHNQLWYLMHVDPHVPDSMEHRFYSPWRPDPRPLSGLYHGLYVFTGVLEYYVRALSAPSLAMLHARIKDRAVYIYFQVRTALSEIPNDQLPARGLEFVEGLGEIIQSSGQYLGVDSSTLPQAQIDHWRHWTVKHPKLVVAADSLRRA